MPLWKGLPKDSLNTYIEKRDLRSYTTTWYYDVGEQVSALRQYFVVTLFGCSVGERKWKEEGEVFNSLIHREEGSIWQDCFILL